MRSTTTHGSSGTGATVGGAATVRPDRSSGDIAAILKAAVPAVVAIVDDGGPDNGGAAGTGFVVSSDGVIVTNNHVVEGADKIQARFSDGTKLDREGARHRRRRSDLAVLKVDAHRPAHRSSSATPTRVQVGDDVVAIGNALALEGGLSVTRGIVSGLHRDVGTDDRGALEDVHPDRRRDQPRATPAARSSTRRVG